MKERNGEYLVIKNALKHLWGSILLPERGFILAVTGIFNTKPSCEISK